MAAATLKEIADRLGIATSTVSRALSGSGLISADTRRRVQQAAAELNYSPNLWAQNLAGGLTRLVGCIVLELTNPFFVPMVRAIEDAADEQDAIVFLGESRRLLKIEKQVVERLRRVRAAGVIITPASAEFAHLRALENENVRVVIVGRQDPSFDSVNVDNLKSGQIAGKHLVGLGHKALGYVYSADPGNIPEVERLEGLRRVTVAEGLANVCLYPAGNNNLVGGRLAAENWASGSMRPTGVFCSNDLLAMGFIARLRELGISTPADVSVVGHDDIPFADLFQIPLTTINFPKAEMGRMAMRILLERMNNPDHPQEPPLPVKNIVLEPQLVVRNSTAGLSS